MKTQVENTSGATRIFGFLPPHGRELAAGEAVIFDGDLRTVLASGRNRYNRNRELDALDEACANGDIALTELVEECAGSSSSSSSSS
jgi:hypothetical protein